MMQYMWGDAGLLPTPLSEDLAVGNPLRWSANMKPDDMVQHLESFTAHNRPVKVRVKQAGDWEVMNFQSKQEALRWLRVRYHKVSADCGDEAALSRTSAHLNDEQVAAAK